MYHEHERPPKRLLAIHIQLIIDGAKAEPAIQVRSLSILKSAFLDNESGVVGFRVKAPK